MSGGRFSSVCVLVLIVVSMLTMGGCSSGPNPALNLGGIDIEEVFNGQITRVHQILGGINTLGDVDKAQGELEQVSMNFDDLIFNSAKLPEDGQTALSLLAVKALPELDGLVGQVKSSPAMEEKLGGVMGDIVGKVRSLI